MLLPVLAFKKEDDHSLDCRFVSICLFEILFEDILFLVLNKRKIYIFDVVGWFENEQKL